MRQAARARGGGNPRLQRHAPLKFKQETNYNYNEVFRQSMLNFMGRSGDPVRTRGRSLRRRAHDRAVPRARRQAPGTFFIHFQEAAALATTSATSPKRAGHARSARKASCWTPFLASSRSPTFVSTRRSPRLRSRNKPYGGALAIAVARAPGHDAAEILGALLPGESPSPIRPVRRRIRPRDRKRECGSPRLRPRHHRAPRKMKFIQRGSASLSSWRAASMPPRTVLCWRSFISKPPTTLASRAGESLR